MSSEIEIYREKLTCPITQMIFAKPVTIFQTGITYEKEAIEKWLNQPIKTCPITRTVLSQPIILVNNETIESLVDILIDYDLVKSDDIYKMEYNKLNLINFEELTEEELKIIKRKIYRIDFNFTVSFLINLKKRI